MNFLKIVIICITQGKVADIITQGKVADIIT